MSQDEHEAHVQELKQAKQRRFAMTNGDGPWTILSDDWHEEDSNNGGYFAAFSRPSHRDEVLSRASWDMTKGDGVPGFSQHWEADEWVTSFERNSHGPDLEPLIIYQEHGGVVPDTVLIDQDFVLLMQLWKDPASGNYYEIKDDGSKELAIKFSGKQIKARTPVLRRYQAARQLDLLLFADSVAFVHTDENQDAFTDLNESDHKEGELSYVAFSVGEMDSGGHRVFSRLLAKRVLPPPPQAKSGIWPWDKEDREYPEFIVGEDNDGKPVKFTCDPEELANYFGKNPQAPHYLTPVFFKPEVLQKYYDDSALYSVTDGRLSCGHLWGCQVDNVSGDYVMVFLGDLGRDLPESELRHWLANNIAPAGRTMSEANFRRSFLGQFADSGNPEHLFKNAYADFKREWANTWGWGLYREPSGPEAEIVKRLRIPLNDTDAEFERQLLALAKVLVDFLNESKLVEGLPPARDEKGISKLRRFLESHSYSETDRDIALLRKIQKLRSRIAAHTSGQSGQELLASELGSLSKPDFIRQLLLDATQMLQSLACLLPPEVR